jgi:hypothetical protein
MDWLRSEDLKEEKVVTTPEATITRQGWISPFQMGPDNRFDCPWYFLLNEDLRIAREPAVWAILRTRHATVDIVIGLQLNLRLFAAFSS